MDGNGLKATIALALTAIGVYFQNIAVPLAILIVLMCLDYCTGMVNAWLKKELSSAKGIQGIIKKVSYFVVVVIGMVADYLICLLGKTIGLALPQTITAIGLLVTIWLILNESISILENLDKIGTPMPAFLKKLMDHLKQTTEKAGDNDK